MSRIIPVYTKGMNDIRRLLDKIGRSDFNTEKKDWLTWTLLTALRGPDNENEALKMYSTARLRAEIFPELSYGARARLEVGTLHKINPVSANTQVHFAKHFNLAIESLEKLNGTQEAGR